MTDETFRPKALPPKFDVCRYVFASGGTVEPFVLWFEACNPGAPRLDSTQGLQRALKADLPISDDEIGSACERLFGPPSVRSDREFPFSPDWVLSTPMADLFLTVKLDADPLERFGFGISHDRSDAMRRDRLSGSDRMAEAAERAILSTLKAIRGEMLALDIAVGRPGSPN